MTETFLAFTAVSSNNLMLLVSHGGSANGIIRLKLIIFILLILTDSSDICSAGVAFLCLLLGVRSVRHNPPVPSPFPSRATERKERDDRARVPGPVSATAPGNTRALFRSSRGKELGLWPGTWIFVGTPGFVTAPV
jgi:hypothetical protein